MCVCRLILDGHNKKIFQELRLTELECNQVDRALHF